ncbi:M48 family metalloprotease [Chitinophaga tropicalis]|uniref:M48 family metalloprotease n=1 Tax=Chitinophaga tropicalis TaxID=2683588 RepID=A0A7K1U7G9_9BACT|nr:M48 family metalloprotease [Chitinophaga tropicalis]MVT10308.1 M48 family metalloprotease [Chitinophaga tropicalis]
MKDVKSVLRAFLLTHILIVIPGHFLSITYGQTPIFTPAKENTALFTSLLTESEKIYKAELAALPARGKKDYEEIYKLHWDAIKEVIGKKEMYTADSARQYLDALVSEIKRANPGLQQQQFRCFFSRSGIPNASYIGSGIILFNMGLFSRLNNESEAAFVLCHEIAHFYLHHMDNAIRKYVDTMNSAQMQEALRQIKDTEYGKRQMLDKLVKGFTFNTRRHSRDHESQADSMALAFMHNTRFDKTAALSLLTLLDNIDEDTLNINSRLEVMFNAEKYPFRKKWTTRKTGLLGSVVVEENKALSDSLKTHPDCQKRIALLSPAISGYQTGNESKDPVSRQQFETLQRTFRYEVIEYAYANDNYSLSLYYTIALLGQLPDDPYLVTSVGRVMNSCYTAQKEHVLGKRIDLPGAGQTGGYNALLHFLQQLYIEDYAGIGYNYLLRYQDRFNDYAAFRKELDAGERFTKE